MARCNADSSSMVRRATLQPKTHHHPTDSKRSPGVSSKSAKPCAFQSPLRIEISAQRLDLQETGDTWLRFPRRKHHPFPKPVVHTAQWRRQIPSHRMHRSERVSRQRSTGSMPGRSRRTLRSCDHEWSAAVWPRTTRADRLRWNASNTCQRL